MCIRDSADTAYFGAEAEFYIFDSVSFDSKMNGTFYEIDSESGWWNSGEPFEADGSPNRGYKVRPKGGYFPVAPYDHYVDLRDQITTNLQNAGFEIERGHHEVGTAGQAEINYKFNTLLHAADDLLLFKYIVKNTAWAAGKTVNLNFFVHDPFTREAYSRDPRNVARKAENYLASTGIADTAYFGAEAEFYIFDSIRHSTGANEAYYYIDSVEGWWNSGKDEPGGNRGYKTAYKLSLIHI